MSTAIRFEDPPPRMRSEVYPVGDFPEILALLLDFPGRWAVIRTYDLAGATAARLAAHNINIARHSTLRPPVGAYKAVSRTVGGEVRLYAQYVPEGGAL